VRRLLRNLPEWKFFDGAVLQLNFYLLLAYVRLVCYALAVNARLRHFLAFDQSEERAGTGLDVSPVMILLGHTHSIAAVGKVARIGRVVVADRRLYVFVDGGRLDGSRLLSFEVGLFYVQTDRAAVLDFEAYLSFVDLLERFVKQEWIRLLNRRQVFAVSRVVQLVTWPRLHALRLVQHLHRLARLVLSVQQERRLAKCLLRALPRRPAELHEA